MPTEVVIKEFGGSENLELSKFSLQSPNSDEVTVEHRAIGLNYIDIYQRTGLYPLELPTALGVEASGIVTEVGDSVAHLNIGDRVAYASARPGAYSEIRNLNATQVCKLPEDVSFKVGAAVMLKGLTVQYLFHRTTPLNRGDTVLFHAAAGGVGLIACQWARSEGINLIGTAGSDEKCQLALQNGARYCINYKSQNFVEEVRELTDGAGVEAVMDSVGASTFEDSLECLKPLGMMISFGNASGKVPPFDISQLAAKGSLKVTRPTIFSHIAERNNCQQMADQLFKKVSDGNVNLLIGQEFHLSEIAKAHDMLEARETTGSTILTP